MCLMKSLKLGSNFEGTQGYLLYKAKNIKSIGWKQEYIVSKHSWQSEGHKFQVNKN